MLNNRETWFTRIVVMILGVTIVVAVVGVIADVAVALAVLLLHGWTVHNIGIQCMQLINQLNNSYNGNRHKAWSVFNLYWIVTRQFVH